MKFYQYETIGPDDAPLPRLSPTRLTKFAPTAGFLLISANGSEPTVTGYTAGGPTTISGDFDLVELVDLDDLSLDQLNQAVDVLDVDTQARTAAGLRAAIEASLQGDA